MMRGPFPGRSHVPAADCWLTCFLSAAGERSMTEGLCAPSQEKGHFVGHVTLLLHKMPVEEL